MRLADAGARTIRLNVWRPIRGPVERSPLALADASSVRFEDLIATDQVFPDRVGEIYSVAYNPAQRWFYFPDMSRDEVVLINQQCEKTHQKKLTNIVFMGMGEPLLNYKNVLRAIDRISSPDGLAMSPRRVTVSTAGVAKMIRQLGDDKVKFKLALSLHAADDRKRHEIMPINDTNNIKSLIDALNYFYKHTKNEITFEYILFNNFNDSLKDADELIKIYRQVPADLINIIEYNPIDFAEFSKPTEEKIQSFLPLLDEMMKGGLVTLEKVRVIDYRAANGFISVTIS